ncbi:MAG: RecX family transcriptional regulator [Alloprevotella sp.]|nr:RecX family transcriptional regulator [Alloprevotella sp.]
MKQPPTPDQLFDRAATLCAHREVCRDDVRQKLYAWGARSEWVDDLLDRLVDEQYIDEQRYAEAFVHDKALFNQWGRVKIRHMLEMKQLPASLIEQALQTIDEDQYTGQLRELLLQKLPTIRAKNEYERAQKLLRFAAGRGYEAELIFQTISNL